nr:MAG TPA: hypothetical protein [Caudoviricetes sp.]
MAPVTAGAVQNNIFIRAAGGRAPTRSEFCRKGWCL